MTWIGWTVLVVAFIALAATVQLARYVRRVDRLDAEVQRTRAALESQLGARATRAVELAHSPRMDPATAMLLADVAGQVLESTEEADGEPGATAAAETELSRSLALLMPGIRAEAEGSPGAVALVDRLERACERVRIAQQLHNSRVAKAVEIRSRYPATVTRLLGLTAPPVPFEIEAGPPESGGEV